MQLFLHEITSWMQPELLKNIPTPKTYWLVLAHFMSFCNNVSYNVDHEFTQKELALITPNDLLHWMNKMTLGIEETNINDNLTLARSMTWCFGRRQFSFLQSSVGSGSFWSCWWVPSLDWSGNSWRNLCGEPPNVPLAVATITRSVTVDHWVCSSVGGS